MRTTEVSKREAHVGRNSLFFRQALRASGRVNLGGLLVLLVPLLASAQSGNGWSTARTAGSSVLRGSQTFTIGTPIGVKLPTGSVLQSPMPPEELMPTESSLAGPGNPAPTSQPNESGRRGPPPVSFQIQFDPSHTTRTSFDDLPGGFRRWDTEIAVGTRLVIAPRQSFSFRVAHKYSQFDFDNTTLIPGKRHPFRELHSTGVFARYTQPLSEDWTFEGSTSISFDREESAHLGDTTQASLLVGARYQVSPKLSITPLLFFNKQLEEDLRVFPVAAVSWSITDRVRLDIGRGASVEFTLDEKRQWFLSPAFRFDNQYYRLDDKGPVRSGLVEIERGWAALELVHRPLPFVTMGGYVGWLFHQEMKVRDRNGDRINSDDGEDAILIGLQGTLRF